MADQSQQPKPESGLAISTKTFSTWMKKFEPQIAALIPKHCKAERMVNLAIAAYTRTPELQKCNMLSIVNSVVLASQLGLEFNNALGHSALIPYNERQKDGSWAMLCQWQPMYRGLITLALRSERTSDVQAHEVYEADEFDFEYGSRQFLHHKPARSGDRGAMIGAYSFVEHTGGRRPSFLWMPADEIERIHEVTQKGDKETPAWRNFRSEMYRKTPTKNLLKYEDLSPATSLAVGLDDQAIAGKQDQVVDVDFSVLQEIEQAERKGRVVVPMPADVKQSENPNRGHADSMQPDPEKAQPDTKLEPKIEPKPESKRELDPHADPDPLLEQQQQRPRGGATFNFGGNK